VLLKSHHYNPQVYLKQFVDPHRKKELWEYDLRTGAVKLSSPKKSGCEDYYHSIVGKDGARDDKAVEESFSVIENRLPTGRQLPGELVPVTGLYAGRLSHIGS